MKKKKHICFIIINAWFRMNSLKKKNIFFRDSESNLFFKLESELSHNTRQQRILSVSKYTLPCKSLTRFCFHYFIAESQ